VSNAVRTARTPDSLRSCRPQANTQVAVRRYPEPAYFSVTNADGETIADELFEREEAVAIARAEEGRVALAHGRYPGAKRFVCWEIGR
jgi:hypothetical protein